VFGRITVGKETGSYLTGRPQLPAFCAWLSKSSCSARDKQCRGCSGVFCKFEEPLLQR
jgi:hypothetical protein